MVNKIDTKADVQKLDFEPKIGLFTSWINIKTWQTWYPQFIDVIKIL